MSIRAYMEVTPPVLSQDPTFNAWRDDVLDYLLDLEYTHNGLNDDGSGTIEIYKDELFELLENPPKHWTKEQCKQLEHDAKLNNEDYITYHLW